MPRSTSLAPSLLVLLPLLVAPVPVAAQRSSSTARDLPTPTDLSSSWTYEGCFTDPVLGGNAALHALNDDYWYNLELTQARCAVFCQQGGYGLAGVEYQTQCVCGLTRMRSSAVQTDEAECDMPCGGNSAIKCGGAYRFNLFVNRDLIVAAASSSSSSSSSSSASSAVASSSLASSSSVSSSSAASSTVASASSAASVSSVALVSSSSVAAAAAAASAASAAAAAAVTPSAGPTASNGGVSGGTIAGAVVGSVLGAVLLAALAFFLCKRRRRRQARRTSGAGLDEKPGGEGGAWFRSGSASEEGHGSLDDKVVAHRDASSRSAQAAVADEDDEPVYDISRESVDAANVLGSPFTNLAAVSPHLPPSSSSSSSSPPDAPYQLGPVAHPSPLLGSGGEAAVLVPPSPGSSWPGSAPSVRGQPHPVGLALDADDGGSPYGGIEHSPPTPYGGIEHSPPTAYTLERRRSSERTHGSAWERRPSASHSTHSSSAGLIPSSAAAAGGRRQSEQTSVVGRNGSVSLARKPVPPLQDGDSTALEQEQYYNQPATGGSNLSLGRRDSAGGSEALKDAGGSPPKSGASGTKTPDLFKGWEGKQMHALDVDRPAEQ